VLLLFINSAYNRSAFQRYHGRVL